MSFSTKVKQELCSIQNVDNCCNKAQLYGLGLLGCFLNVNSIYLKSDNKIVCDLFAQLCAENIGLIADVNSYYRNKIKLAYLAKLAYKEDNLKFINYFGHEGDDLQLQINHAIFKNSCCITAFLRGVFLAAATITDPKSDYHIEIKTKYLKLSNQLISLIKDIEQLDVNPGIVNKKGCFLVYIKGAEAVADMLTYLGACNSAMDIMQVKILKEIRNNINRTTNFETANIGRTIKASVKQLNAIRFIEQKKGLEFLDEPLRHTAKVRLENPESSLNELCELIGGVSRSGLNHRLNKIIDISKKLKSCD